MKQSSSPEYRGMCFGLDRDTDERSLAEFLTLFAAPRLTEVLIPRLEDRELDTLVDNLFNLLRRHLSKDEYHRLFLGEEHHHHPDEP